MGTCGGRNGRGAMATKDGEGPGGSGGGRGGGGCNVAVIRKVSSSSRGSSGEFFSQYWPNKITINPDDLSSSVSTRPRLLN
jgi:hypothetical protein